MILIIIIQETNTNFHINIIGIGKAELQNAVEVLTFFKTLAEK